MLTGSAPGPAPAAHARRNNSSCTFSSWLTWPQVKLRRNVPSVEGARTPWPSTEGVSARRIRSASSMQSPPANAECTKVMAFSPTFDRPAASPRSTCRSNSSPMPSRWASVAGKIIPALATAWSASKVTTRRSKLWQDSRIEKVPSGHGMDHGVVTRSSLTGAALSRIL